MQVPRGLPADVGLSTISKFDLVQEAGPAAGGRMQAVFDPVPSSQLWLVERIVVSSTSTAKTEARFYAGREEPVSLLDGTRSGNLDIADNSSPMQVTSSIALLVVWTGADDGSVGSVRIQGSVLQYDAS